MASVFKTDTYVPKRWFHSHGADQEKVALIVDHTEIKRAALDMREWLRQLDNEIERLQG